MSRAKPDRSVGRTWAVYSRVHAFVSSRCPELSSVEFQFCPEVRKSAADPRRAYAHWGHVKNTICYARQIKNLSKPHAIGVLLHEFGHVGSRGGESLADLWVIEVLGIPIQYRGKLNLEWVDPQDIRRLKI